VQTFDDLFKARNCPAADGAGFKAHLTRSRHRGGVGHIKREFDPTDLTCPWRFQQVISVGVRSQQWPRPR
jgi:hypothetical protein